MFGWFKKRRMPLQPEASWVVVVAEDTISSTDHTGVEKSLLKDEVSGVLIETNDSGPWGADVWWLLFGKDDELACAFPQGATGEDEALDFLMKLEGFDEQQMINAMGSTDNAIFPVWRKKA